MENKKIKKRKNYDKGRIFVKIVAGVLVVLMLGVTFISGIFALI